jgi:hypothetical protein
MSKIFGWVTIGCFVADGVLLVANGFHHGTTIAERHRLAAALPPHSCGSVILPGEECGKMFEARLRLERSH